MAEFGWALDDMNMRLDLGDIWRAFAVEEAEVMAIGKADHVVVLARQVAMWVMRKRGYSFPAIGRRIGHRDHTTVMHAIKSIEKKAARDPSLRAVMDRLGAPRVPEAAG